MLEELTKAARVASDKGGLPIMAAVLVRDGTLTAGNGAVSLTVPCPDLAGHTFAVDADRFLAAVKAADGAPKLKMTDGGKLSVVHGKFRALIPLMDADNYPAPTPDEDAGDACPADFMELLATLAPFIATDKARPWATGVKLTGYVMLATNGTVAVSAKTQGAFKSSAVIPLAAVEALLGIKASPATLLLTTNSATFRWADGSVMTVALLSYDWPDMTKLLADGGNQQPVPEGLADAVKRIKPFCPNKDHAIIRLTADGKVCTADGDSSGSQDGFSFANESAFIADELLAVLALAETIDMAGYPVAVPFAGGKVRGVIAGVRL